MMVHPGSDLPRAVQTRPGRQALQRRADLRRPRLPLPPGAGPGGVRGPGPARRGDAVSPPGGQRRLHPHRERAALPAPLRRSWMRPRQGRDRAPPQFRHRGPHPRERLSPDPGLGPGRGDDRDAGGDLRPHPALVPIPPSRRPSPLSTPGPAPGPLLLRPRPRAHRRVLRRTLSGGVTMNDVLQHLVQIGLPFGGVGPSGMGHYHGFTASTPSPSRRPSCSRAGWASRASSAPPTEPAHLKALIQVPRPDPARPGALPGERRPRPDSAPDPIAPRLDSAPGAAMMPP